MADRIPLIVNPSVNQIQELPTNDILQLNDSNQIHVGTDGDLVICYPYSVGGVSESGSAGIVNTTGAIRLSAPDNSSVSIRRNGTNDTDSIAFFDMDGGVALSWRGASGKGIKLEVKETGVDINGALTASGDITAFYSSDRRLKDNITPIPNAVDKVLSISGNTFNWNATSDYEGKGDTGVIAQEVEALDLPGVTATRENGYKAVRYEKLVPLLIEAIKELEGRIKTLEG